MSLLSQIFTWWDEQTLGTRLMTWRKGKLVGEDDQGNKFYQTADGKRRWVIYNGEIEASKISPDWHGWLHHTFDENPSGRPLVHKEWEKPHQANATGSDAAYHPPGSIFSADPVKRQDYEAWQPE